MKRLTQKDLLESFEKLVTPARARQLMYYGSRNEQAHKQIRELLLCEDMVQQYRDEMEAEQAETELAYLDIILDLCGQLEAKK